MVCGVACAGMLAVSIVGLVIHAVLTLRKLSWASCSMRLKAWRRRQAESPDTAESAAVTRLVALEVEKRINGRVAGLAEVFGLLWIGHRILYMYRVAFDSDGGWLTVEQDGVMIASGWVFLFVRLFAHRIHGKVVHALHAALVALACATDYYANQASAVHTLRTLTMTAIIRVIYSAIFCHVPTTAALNVVTMALNGYILAQSPMCEGPGCQGDFFMFEMAVTALIICMAWQARNSLQSECSKTVHLRGLNVEFSALLALLNIVCDVVVELDASLKIAGPAPKLAAMLSLGVDKRMVGLTLTHFMPLEEHRARFTEGISSRSAGDASPGGLHATLRDSMSGNIDIDLFYVLFPSPGGRVRYYVGIRECSDLAAPPPGPLPGPIMSPCIDSEPWHKPTDGGHQASGRADTEARGRQSSASTSETEEPSSVAPGTSAGTGVGSASDSDTSSATQSTSRASSQGRRLRRVRRRFLDDRFGLTSARAKKLCLAEAILQWNIPVPRRACCEFHAAVQDLQAQAKELARMGCRVLVSCAGDSQCSECGMVLDHRGDPSYQHCAGAPVVRARDAAGQAVGAMAPEETSAGGAAGHYAAPSLVVHL
mmetsp:Transcript_26833/g.77594  ORF Transcript_26833/g.77594 Transcript_26833/m.77594 type:complete len:598 (-) Transcript_26833:460-2253(-)